jgi:4-hydroxy-2-oxoglutarate aldolase
MVSNEHLATSSNGQNGSEANGSAKIFPPGIHVPSLTFFKDDVRQEIDWDVQKRHLDFLVKSGLHGSK